MIRIRELYKQYDDHIVLENLCLDIEAGVTCILGPSGCGKTTLLRLIAGLESPDSGIIEFPKDKKISLVFQEDRLFDYLSAVRNVLVTAPRGFSETEATDLLHRLGIQNVRQKVSGFSGGMRRRVAIVRALCADHDILLLDEPFTGLDEESRSTVLNEILSSEAKRTVICVTHDSRDVERLHARSIVMPIISGEY